MSTIGHGPSPTEHRTWDNLASDELVRFVYQKTKVTFAEVRGERVREKEGIFRGYGRDDDDCLFVLVESPVDHSLWKWKLTRSGRPGSLKRLS